MKKKYLALIPVAGMFMIGCSSTKSISKIEGNKLVWTYAGSLPAQKGYDKNIGTAGLLQGVIGEYVIVGGGANFPDVLEKGGKKITHKDVYLLKDVNGSLEVVEQVQLDYPIGYGLSVSVKEENAIYYLGGSPDSSHSRDILKVTVNNGKLNLNVVGQLPLSVENGVAQYRNEKIYYGVGKLENPSGKNVNSNKFFAYDLKENKVEELADFPGAARQQAVGQILNDKFYVFSGGASTSFVDGYAYDFEKNVWLKASDVVINNEKILLLGANSLKISEDKMMVIGGFNYDLWNDANHYLSSLKDEALQEYKKEYFGAEPNWYKWNRKVLIYDATNDAWKTIGEIPFDAPCGAALLNVGNSIYSINGEIKPGVRTERMFKGTVVTY